VTRVYVGAGRKAGIRPGDLVGAIANEAQIDSRSIGAIEVADRLSLVAVPESMAAQLIDAKYELTTRIEDFELYERRQAAPKVNAAPAPAPL
jgi:hypothetical protein